jgi:hypothetical protein
MNFASGSRIGGVPHINALLMWAKISKTRVDVYFLFVLKRWVNVTSWDCIFLFDIHTYSYVSRELESDPAKFDY